MAQIKISELNELETIQDDDLFVVVDESEGETKKAKSKNVRAKNKPLIAVTDEEPTEFNEDDEYYNTETRLIYKAINSTTWSVEGKVPEEGIMYVVFPEKSTFAWDGSDLISVGGGSGSQVIVPGEEITEDTKIEIEDEDFDFKGSEITDEYSESTEVGYSANYSNGHFQTKGQVLWTNLNPTSSFGTQDITLNSDDYDLLLWLFSTNTNNDQYISFETIKGKGIYANWAYNNGFLAREINYVNDTTYSIGNNLLNGSVQNINMLPQYVIGYKF